MSLEPQGGPPQEIRVSDEERAQVVDRLRRHCAEGRITLDEFSDRAGQVYAAKTRSELVEVLADLPEPVPFTASNAPAVPRSTTRWVVGVMGGGHSKGRWRPDEQVTALAVMGGCLLDLRQAEIDGPVVDITAIAIMGGVEIIVPEGIAVEMSGVAIMGGKDCRVKDVTPLPGTPVIRVNAFAFWGGVTVRNKRDRAHHAHLRERTERQHDHAERQIAHAERHAARALERASRYAPMVEEVLGAFNQGMKPKPPSALDGTVTILFSDIEDFTGITERLGDLRAQDVLHSHNDIVRRSVAASEGYEVKSQGDSFMLAFASARRALNCAVDMQRSFDRWSTSRPDIPLRVRMGLHTGETIREADDLFGRTVILASRIAAEAGGGQILVSSLLKELTESSGEFCFSPGREVALKGLSRMQVVHEVDWSGALLGVTTAAVVLAAGSGSRFHGDGHKLLSDFRGRPLASWALWHAIQAGLDETVVVTGAVDLTAVIERWREVVAVVENDRWEQGQASSLQAAVHAARARGHDAIVVGLGDQPLVPPEAWAAVARSPSPIAVATYAGRRRHPVRLGESVWPLLPTVGDQGARVVISQRPELVVEVACEGEPSDIDTLEDLAKWT